MLICGVSRCVCETVEKGLDRGAFGLESEMRSLGLGKGAGRR